MAVLRGPSPLSGKSVPRQTVPKPSRRLPVCERRASADQIDGVKTDVSSLTPDQVAEVEMLMGIKEVDVALLDGYTNLLHEQVRLFRSINTIFGRPAMN